MASKNIVITNGSISETTYNADKIDAQLATARAVTGNSTFNGNVAVTGNETVGGTLAVTGAVTGGEIVENMTGYSAEIIQTAISWTPIYVSAVKNGNKLTFVVFGKYTKQEGDEGEPTIVRFNYPSAVGVKLIPYTISGLSRLNNGKLEMFSNVVNSVSVPYWYYKDSDTSAHLDVVTTNLVVGTEYVFRSEVTFLLSDNMAS